MNKSESITELAKALSVFQGEVKGIKKDSTNPFFKMHYASLSAIWDAIRVPLCNNGLAVSQVALPDLDDGHIILETILLHESGEWLSGFLPIKPTRMGKDGEILDNDSPQGMGSAITYARRYGLCAMLGIVADEDDDGETAHDRKAKPPAQVKPKAVQSTTSLIKEESDSIPWMIKSCREVGWTTIRGYMGEKYNISTDGTIEEVFGRLNLMQRVELSNEIKEKVKTQLKTKIQ